MSVLDAIVAQPGQPGNVLIIDDKEASHYVLRQMLGNCAPLHIQEAETGAKGLWVAQSWCADVILLDIRPPISAIPT